MQTLHQRQATVLSSFAVLAATALGCATEVATPAEETTGATEARPASGPLENEPAAPLPSDTPDPGTPAPPADGTAAVGDTYRTTMELNLRSGPGTEYEILIAMPEDAVVTLLAAAPTNGFYNVKYASLTGWASAKYLVAAPGATVVDTPPAAPGSVDDIDAFAKTTLDRALEWVKIKMPYCGGSNHGTDYLCGGTCVRTGIHASSVWDPYRTDCSGFVSWSWKLPAPGRITTDFAPFNNAVTTVIKVDELRPGDALNNETHIILFGGWANAEHTKARLLEEYDCGQVAVDRIRSISKSSSTQVNVGGSTFNAIRYDNRP